MLVAKIEITDDILIDGKNCRGREMVAVVSSNVNGDLNGYYTFYHDHHGIHSYLYVWDRQAKIIKTYEDISILNVDEIFSPKSEPVPLKEALQSTEPVEPINALNLTFKEIFGQEIKTIEFK